ncbi:MAG: transposase [Bacteroides sp.]|jgi:transposase|nr:transposase [Bacteroides sp.]MCI1682741.1 transposase [Bacteroides sp.]
MEQMYGIDLGLPSFEVSFFDVQGQLHHLKQVKNTVEGIGLFLSLLPLNACLCAENAGLYGDLLLHLCSCAGVPICFVPGYKIKHSMGLQRGKSDEVDACRIREYAERFSDRLQPCSASTEELEELQELYRTRGQLVESRKRLSTLNRGDNCKVMVSLAAARVRQHLLDELDEQIRGLDAEIDRLIKSNPEQEKSYRILTSVSGVGPVTACELIIKTEDFQKLDTAKRCAAYAGIAPYPKE